MDWDKVKQALGKKAAEMVPTSGIIGLGSGTTSMAFLRALMERRRRERLDIVCVATSVEIEKQAVLWDIPLVDGVWKGLIDVVFDGADAVYEDKTVIKGAGGAFVREKIVADRARRRVYMVDERKWKRPQNECMIPVAVIPFGHLTTQQRLEQLGFRGSFRVHNETPFITDDGMYVFDVEAPQKAVSLKVVDEQLRSVPGVVSTGIFFGIATEIMIGYGDGNIIHI